MAQGVECLPSPWETWLEFLAPGFNLLVVAGTGGET